jgi:CubicO group peptidase (beta-lactamase class C family)
MSYKAAVKFISFLLLLSAHPAFSQVGAENKIDELLSAYAKAYKLNGTVLVSSGGKTIFNKGYGADGKVGKMLWDQNGVIQTGKKIK